MADVVLSETKEEIAVLTINRPEARNAFNFEAMEKLETLLPKLNEDPAIRGVVLTGAGDKAFSAGMDIKIASTFDAESAASWMRRLKKFFSAIRDMDKPVVAAVNGVAAGAGYQVALLCDVRVGHVQARMGQPEINVGLASVVGAQIMELSLGISRTVELTLSGRMMEGEECRALGLFHHLVDQGDVMPQAVLVARELGQKPPHAMRLTKQRFREVTQAAFDDAFEAGARLQAAAYRSGEPQAAMAAFNARKK